MSFWNRKKKTPDLIQPLFESGAIKELEKAILKSSEATNQSIKEFQKLAAAINNNTREIQKSSKK